MARSSRLSVNFRGGIVSPGYLSGLLNILKEAGLQVVRFGLRQQLLADIPAVSLKKITTALIDAGIEYGINGNGYPNINSSYAAAEIFVRETWVKEGVYKDVFSLFDYKPSLKINIVDSNQTFTPFFTGNINWIASIDQHFWWLVIRFPKTNVLYYWKDLVYTNDISLLSAAIEQLIIAEPALYYDNQQADGSRLYEMVKAKGDFTTKPVTKPLELPALSLPYYEGYNSYGNKSWLGIYRREEVFDIDFLQEICRVCLETKTGELYTTPWKSIIIKGIEDKHRAKWSFILRKFRINVRHASNELNWQVEDDNSEGLTIKRNVIRQFDKDDVRTYGLCFAVKTQPKSGVFGSVLIRKQFNKIRSQLKPLDKYDILYTAGFNPNSKDYILFRGDVQKEYIGTYLVALCKYYYEQEDAADLLPGSSYTHSKSEESEIIPAKEEYHCMHCFTVYDEAAGDPMQQIMAGTSFKALPASWNCPLCEAPKNEFVKKENTVTALQAI